MKTNAIFSQDRAYRYLLTRIWDGSKPCAALVGLNPSKADEIDDDNTSSKWIRFAKKWGYGGTVMANVFAVCETSPDMMKKHHSPIGPDNDTWLSHVFDSAMGLPSHPLMPKIGIVVAGWGNDGSHLGRGLAVYRQFSSWSCLRTTQRGEPHHPLYLSEKLIPIVYTRDTLTREGKTE